MLIAEVEIYGSLTPGATSLASRPDFRSAAWQANASILTGDLLGNDTADPATRSDNAHNVIRSNGSGSLTVVDGFSVVAGNAVGGFGIRGAGGGLLCNYLDAPTVRNVAFVGNGATWGGAVLHGGSAAFINCDFIGNSAMLAGGAMRIEGPLALTPLLERCFFGDNRAANGGGLSVTNHSVLIANSVFAQNVSTRAGGAISVQAFASANVRNCTIVDNRSLTGAEGGIANYSAFLDDGVRATNCILWNNVGSGGAMGSVNQVTPRTTTSYSIVEGGAAMGNHNLQSPPQFVSQSGLDFRLLNGSPAIDEGTGNGSDIPVESIELDFGSRRRVADGSGSGMGFTVDIGAHEFSTNLGTLYCTNVAANSTGNGTRLNIAGSTSVGANDVTLMASGLPTNAFGYFLVSRDRGFVATAGGSQGNLCLGGAIGRYSAPGQIGNSGMTGNFELVIVLGNVPQPTGFVSTGVGDTWQFQTWHRDSFMGTPTSNFSDAVSGVFGI